MVLIVCLGVQWIQPDLLHAAFTEQIAVDPKAISLANSVTADPPGIAAIHYNPAGLSHMPEGKYVTLGVTLPRIKKTSYFEQDPNFEGFLGGFKDDPLAGTHGTNSHGHMYMPIMNQELTYLFAPDLGLSYRAKGSRWTFAIGQYAPFAVGFDHDDPNDPVRYGAKRVFRQHLVYIAPAVSYQMTDTFSLGLTVGLGQSAMGGALDMRAPNDMVALTKVIGDSTEDLEVPILSELTFPPPWFGGGVGPYDRLASFEMSMRDDFSPNFNLGLLWEPYRWFSLGAVYQSPIKVQLTGRYRFDYSEQFQRMVNWFGSSPTLLMISGMLNLPINAVPGQSGTVTSEYEFPQRVQLGIKLKPFKRLTLLADLHWANWSVLEEDRYTFDQDIQLLQLIKVLGYTGGNRDLVLRRNFKDTWHWSVGLELQLTDWLAWRMGYEYRPTSVQMELYDSLYALPDLAFYSTGFNIKLKNDIQIDLGFGYLVNDDLTIPNNSSTLLNSTNSFAPVYNPYAGLDYRQKTEVYLGSVKLTMPLEVMSDILDRTLDLLNPFSSGEHRSKSRVVARTARADSQSPENAALARTSTVPVAPNRGIPNQPVRGAPTEARSEPHPFTLELAAFDAFDRARMAQAFYRASGQAVEVIQEAGRWRLVLGSYATLQEAASSQERLGLFEARIHRRPSVATPAENGPYTLEVARFASRPRAEMARHFYALAGFAPRLAAGPESGPALFWTVRIGQFDSMAAAMAYQQSHSLPEATIDLSHPDPASEPGTPYALCLAEFRSSDRARLAQEFYRSQGLTVSLQSRAGGYALMLGQFGSSRLARRYQSGMVLPEARVVSLKEGKTDQAVAASQAGF